MACDLNICSKWANQKCNWLCLYCRHCVWFCNVSLIEYVYWEWCKMYYCITKPDLLLIPHSSCRFKPSLIKSSALDFRAHSHVNLSLMLGNPSNLDFKMIWTLPFQSAVLHRHILGQLFLGEIWKTLSHRSKNTTLLSLLLYASSHF